MFEIILHTSLELILKTKSIINEHHINLLKHKQSRKDLFMLKYEFEEILMSTIDKELKINLNEKEHRCTLSITQVNESTTIVTYTGSILIERLNPKPLENKYIEVDFVITHDKDNLNKFDCNTEIVYEYKD